MKRYLLFCADGGSFHTSYKNIDLADFQRRWDGVFWDSPREAYRGIRAWRAQTLSGKFYVKLSKPHHFRFLEACKPPSKFPSCHFMPQDLLTLLVIGSGWNNSTSPGRQSNGFVTRLSHRRKKVKEGNY